MVTNCGLDGQFHLPCMVYLHLPAFVPANVIDGFAESVEGKHRKDGEHSQYDASLRSLWQTLQPVLGQLCHLLSFVAETPEEPPRRFSDTVFLHSCHRLIVCKSLFSMMVNPSMVNPLGLSSEREAFSRRHVVTRLRSVMLLCRIICCLA